MVGSQTNSEKIRGGDHHAPEDVPEALDESPTSIKFGRRLAYSPLGSPGTTWMNGDVLKEPVIISIAEKLGKTPAQVALRWNIQMGHSVIPKSTNEERIKQNLDIYDGSIPDDLLAKFSEIKQARLVRGDILVNPQSVYKTLEELWDGEL
ncbi:putative oxidoreductase, aldo/keto reductase family protein [Panicum miliaceum]|uniref:Oxidoreductase, aldo/keto reductase family protein n=1 Tax=Panicum miliaceum TaxID=4540 RepID=A0A3L6SLG4_PANMI|nr:putative oxidoreductase, aldo/keto reductase family protein [Panicum miliaceum]